MMEYPVIGSSMEHGDHHGTQNRIPDAAASHDWNLPRRFHHAKAQVKASKNRTVISQ